ncbi:MAG: helix-turn-helix transcriptional regulator [Aequorivita sp.]|nr:helix-turn-helix transcriptional regulator [Aequorivita sp.]HPE82832.1 helix-turn-helix transcriptional regulator [Aequorivita sp.]
MINSSDFVKRLEKIMEYYGITATTFAEKMDFNRSTISHLLSGRNKPSLEFVMKLLQKFPEVEMNWLLYGKGSFPSTPENKNSMVAPKQKTIAPEGKNIDLFSKEENWEENKTIQINQNSKNIERIVIFYSDGSFNVYQN